MTASKPTALITGASSGIGAVYADRLAKRGHDLVLAARDGARMEQLAARLRRDTGVTAEVLPVDLTRDGDVATVERRLSSGDIGLLVNNAGMTLTGGIVDTDPAQLSRIIALNITATTRLAAAAAKVFLAAGGGAIINVGSVLALAPERVDGVYSGTKAFLLNLSQSMAAQLADKGIYVQALLPGATRTEIWERSGKDVDSFPADILMDVEELVDAALVGFDRREHVTIPSLAALDDWEAMQQSRLAMSSRLSSSTVASRYR